ncbi:MAG: hypothetical protein LBE21_07750 [Pseudomonadales bacterium]|jgi:predicted O-linked N-acetylglucosamine transferase (SPINDLY family)|nr:hypothetical protein [Pseudomonadales bacterium]
MDEAKQESSPSFIAIGQDHEAALRAFAERKYALAAQFCGDQDSLQKIKAESFRRLKRYEESELIFNKILTLGEDYESYVALGSIYLSTGRKDAAIRAYVRAMDISQTLPNEPATHGLVGLNTDKNYIPAIQNLASLYTEQRRHKEAIPVIQRLAGLTQNKSFYHVLGNLCQIVRDYANAEDAFFKAEAWGELQFLLRERGRWDQLDEVDLNCLEALKREEPHTSEPMALIHMPGLTASLQKEVTSRFVASRFHQYFSDKNLSRVENVRVDGEALRIGYLSADFREHATMFLLAGVLEQHARSEVEVELFSTHRQRDGYTARARSALPFHDISALGDRAAIDYIKQRNIHILVDLNGHALGARREVVAARPAAVIVNWLGYPGTMGDPRLADYIIGDSVVTPLDHAGHFSETLALMPHCYQPNDDRRGIMEAASREAVGLPSEGFVYACFAKMCKINPEIFDQWCRLLADTAGAVLWLLDPGEDAQRAALRQRAGHFGVAPERLIFAPKRRHEFHLGRLKFVDLLLDTFPYTSHTTASDGLWAGVPLVTRMGGTFVSRVAASLLSTHGFSELISTDEAGYFELALSLAHNPVKLAAIRERLRSVRQSSPLFDTRRFTRDLERLYKTIWFQHNAPGKTKEPIVLSPCLHHG